MDFLESIRSEGDLFYATALAADPSLGVPCCPDWTIHDLAWHLGEVHWFWAADIEQRASEPGQIELGKPARPAAYPEVVAWGRAQLDQLLRALEATADNVRLWTWAMDELDHTVGFIRRHQVQETAVHRWDMQSAANNSDPDPIDPEAASDSIDEFLSVTVPFAVNKSKPLSGSVHLHCTDGPGSGTSNETGPSNAVTLRATSPYAEPRPTFSSPFTTASQSILSR